MFFLTFPCLSPFKMISLPKGRRGGPPVCAAIIVGGCQQGPAGPSQARCSEFSLIVNKGSLERSGLCKAILHQRLGKPPTGVRWLGQA